ncbi:FAD-dependent monooxygenase [Methylobacterium sp. R2-1]|uniref:FAD-dependent monooxygenase n=1 Tax=Methylobacterium sp. R2-1 TaxID=2587064 RepID=UPI0016166B3F|nr:FAD-dependent monooxygenase [Methylobacterium sp. R2-1]MBB2962618.1 2-polyprenyl-6-methoxyphenol hydroxylase-like FAD-dependent oxidoreductase [Methylobacterium sp. R2-1]
MSILVHSSPGTRRRVLISGASIAGPTLAYWLNRYGFDVTVVERAPAVRSGGYAIDIRGTALGVVERMGLRPQIDAAHIASRGLTFVDAQGETIGTVPIYDLTSNDLGRDVELPRGTLTDMLYSLTRESAVCYRFEDTIEAINGDENGVHVRFRSGIHDRYDVVIGADGLHSNTRRLVFGSEETYSHYLGFAFNIFSVPNNLGLSQEAVLYAEPGRIAGVFAIRDCPDLFAFLIFAAERPPFSAHADRAEQIERTAALFEHGGWQVPRLVEAMRHADDLYFDTVSQIRMPSWSKGRVALVGDAACAPSFRAGQGTSMALVGAYVLAGELATHDNPEEAFAAYERIVRPYMEANQALAVRDAANIIFPRTQQDLDARNQMLASIRSDQSGTTTYRDTEAEAAHNALELCDYD